MLPIHYSLYHDKRVNVNTLLYAQLCMESFHWKILLCLRKERLHIHVMFVDFLSAVAFLVPNSGSVQPNTRREEATMTLLSEYIYLLKLMGY